jgi:hypothetical protein
MKESKKANVAGINLEIDEYKEIDKMRNKTKQKFTLLQRAIKNKKLLLCNYYFIIFLSFTFFSENTTEKKKNKSKYKVNYSKIQLMPPSTAKLERKKLQLHFYMTT